MALRAVFIDKDGTLIPDIPYNVRPELITLSPGAGETLRHLKDEGYLLIMISNQSGIAKGLFEASALQPVKERINTLLGDYGVSLDQFYYCPHEADNPQCDCRKPKPGMLLRAAALFDIDLAQSWMIGDITTDSEAGNRAGCRTILIEKPYDPIIHLNEHNRPDYIANDWWTVGQLILLEQVKHER